MHDQTSLHQMSGLPREAPCVEPPSDLEDGTNICPLTTEQVLTRLRNESLIFPPWTVPSYRYSIAVGKLRNPQLQFFPPFLCFNGDGNMECRLSLLAQLRYISITKGIEFIHNFMFNCSNLGFALLGRCLVEHVFPGMTYEDYVIKNILQPLGLTNTGFNITKRYIPTDNSSAD